MDEPIDLKTMAPPALSTEERDALHAMTQSQGWEIVAGKLLPYYRGAAVAMAINTLDKRVAGYYDGLKFAEEMILRSAEPPRRPDESRERTEADLWNKPSGTGGILG